MAQTLDVLRLAVKYWDDDGYIKIQGWGTDFFEQTDRLVFSLKLMKPDDQLTFNKRQDWRKKPCLVRYRRNGKADFICERGGDGLKNPASTDRGIPQGIEFHFLDKHGVRTYYHCGKAWMDDTAELVFQHDDPAGLSIVHTAYNGAKSILDVPKIGKPGRMPGLLKTGEHPCAYNVVFTRSGWA